MGCDTFAYCERQLVVTTSMKAHMLVQLCKENCTRSKQEKSDWLYVGAVSSVVVKPESEKLESSWVLKLVL